MKTKLRIVLLAVIVTALPCRMFAIFGIGDIVFDPAAYAEIVNLYNQGTQMVGSLRNMSQMATQQRDSLRSINTAVGDASALLSMPRAFTAAQFATLLKSIPGLEGVKLEKIFNQNGALDIFMGTPIGDWKATIENPYNYQANILKGRAISNIGQSLGANNEEIAFASWLSGQQGGTLDRNRSAILSSAADLALKRWLETAKKRRDTLQVAAERSAINASQAGSEKTVLEQQRTGNVEAHTQTQAVLTAAAQQNEATEVLVGAHTAELEMLRQQSTDQRVHVISAGVPIPPR